MTNEQAISIMTIQRPRTGTKEKLEAYDMAIKALEEQPKVGEWLKNGELCKCSNCHSNVLFSAVKLYNYCYRCGAKMEVSE